MNATHFLHTHAKLRSEDPLPFDLLLLADETKEAIEKYIYNCEVYLVTQEEKPIAVFALYRLSDTEIEIKNIAIVNELQGKGIGSTLINEVKQIAKAGNYKSLIVDTGDASTEQIRFYEKNSLEKYALKKNSSLKIIRHPSSKMECN